MSMVPALQQFLELTNRKKAQLSAAGYKANQTTSREWLAYLASTYLTNYNRSLLAIDEVVMHGHYPLPVRIYHPEPTQSLPVAVFLHGGGHMCGGISVYDGIARKLAATTQHIIVAVDYRLAPEFGYPIGLHDCKAAIRALFPLLEARQINYLSRDLTLIGDSAGGALCASLIMDKAFVAVEQIKQQILIYPSLDYTLTSPTVTQFASGYFLEKSQMAWYFDNYFQNQEQRQLVSPVYGEFYAKMPRTLILVAEFDPLYAEGEAYYRNLNSVGVAGELIAVPGVVHAYLFLENLCPEQCAFTYQMITKFLQEPLT